MTITLQRLIDIHARSYELWDQCLTEADKALLETEGMDHDTLPKPIPVLKYELEQAQADYLCGIVSQNRMMIIKHQPANQDEEIQLDRWIAANCTGPDGDYTAEIIPLDEVNRHRKERHQIA